MENFNFAQLNKEALLPEVRKCYGFADSMQIRLLKYSENLTYLLFDAVTEEKYVLRVFRPGYHPIAEMAGELTWIHRIIEQTDVRTADVIKGRTGTFVCPVEVEGYLLNCALFEYVEGQSLHDLGEEERLHYMEKMGEIAAKLHLQVMNWPESGKLVRFGWDFEDLAGENARWGSFTLMKALPQEWMDTYKKAVSVIERRLKKFGHGRERYGLIHDDISINNVLAVGDEIYLLDFDDCGFGWFLYDLGTIVLEDFGEALEKGMQAMLRGYERIRPLSKEEKEELFSFILLKKIVRIGWLATRSDNDTVKGVKPDYFQKTAELATEYCRKYERLSQPADPLLAELF